eukprot:351973-Chlamydomonas_euryale.AAC.8
MHAAASAFPLPMLVHAGACPCVPMHAMHARNACMHVRSGVRTSSALSMAHPYMPPARPCHSMHAHAPVPACMNAHFHVGACPVAAFMHASIPCRRMPPGRTRRNRTLICPLPGGPSAGRSRSDSASAGGPGAANTNAGADPKPCPAEGSSCAASDASGRSDPAEAIVGAARTAHAVAHAAAAAAVAPLAAPHGRAATANGCVRAGAGAHGGRAAAAAAAATVMEGGLTRQGSAAVELRRAPRAAADASRAATGHM